MGPEFTESLDTKRNQAWREKAPGLLLDSTSILRIQRIILLHPSKLCQSCGLTYKDSREHVELRPMPLRPG